MDRTQNQATQTLYSGLGVAWRGLARQGEARQGKDSREKSLLYAQISQIILLAWQGGAGQGLAGQGKAWLGLARAQGFKTLCIMRKR